MRAAICIQGNCERAGLVQVVCCDTPAAAASVAQRPSTDAGCSREREGATNELGVSSLLWCAPEGHKFLCECVCDLDCAHRG